MSAELSEIASDVNNKIRKLQNSDLAQNTLKTRKISIIPMDSLLESFQRCT